MPWTIADDQTVSLNCKVKLEDLNYPTLSDVSDGVFDIKEYLDVTNPINGASVTATDNYSITWDKYGTGVTEVILEYSKDGGLTWNYVNPVSPYKVPNSGSYLWSVPANALSSQAQIRVTDPGNANASDTGNNFWIKGELTVTTPSGTESWNVGTAHQIAWTKKGNIPSINIYYSADDGTTWTPVDSGVSGTSPYTWNISGGATLTILGKIKLEDAAFPTVTGISANNFEIKGNITNVVVSPITGGILNYTGPAASFNVNWDYQGAISTVQVYYSTDGGTTYPPGNLMGEVSASLKPATLTIPNAIGTNVRIKVAAKANPNVYGESSVFAF
jgi:hypothetical protein